jgi:ketosteroid isomerase-like protein
MEVIDAGEQVLVFLRMHAVGKSSGVPVQIDIGHVLTIRDGAVVMVRAFLDREKALAAAGLDQGRA